MSMTASMQIAMLHTGDEITFGSFTVKRKNRDSFVLSDARNVYRKRWGTYPEICEDIEFALANDKLPAPDMAAW